MRLNMNNVRLRNKMLIMYFLSVFIPIVLTNVIFYSIVAGNIRQQKLNDISLTVEQIRDEFQDEINSAAGISTVLYNDSLLWQYVEEQYDSQVDYVENYNSYISLILEKYSPLSKTVKAITIYTENDSIVYGGRVQPISSLKNQPWYDRMITASPSAVDLEKIESDEPGGVETLSMLRRIAWMDGERKRPLLLRIDFQPDLAEEVFRNVTLNGTLYLLRDKHVFYTTDGDPAQLGLWNPDKDKGTILFEEAFTASYLMDWWVAGEFQEQTVLSDVRKSRQFVLYFALLNLVVPTLIIIWFNRSLHARLVRILKQMKRVENHTFEPILELETRDEIGQLTHAFNQMTYRIRSLISDVYIADIQKKELEIKRNQAQLNALQSQINPHFLFNALETIRMRSLIKQETETAHIIQNMAKIFRKSLSWGRDWVTVKEEIDLVICFLKIQKYRFEDKLHYEIEVDPAVERTLIPKMALQPLVENASIHGIEAVKRRGFIKVSVKQEGSAVVCKVTDNGGGIEPDKLKAIMHDLTHSEEMGERIGIANVYYRLKLYYGDGADFIINSEPGVGTTVEIIVRESRDSEV